jgi:hypothetical protein
MTLYRMFNFYLLFSSHFKVFQLLAMSTWESFASQKDWLMLQERNGLAQLNLELKSNSLKHLLHPF